MYLAIPSCLPPAPAAPPAGVSGLGDCGCGCGGHCGKGLGQNPVADALSQISDTLQTSVLGFPLWGWVLGGIALVWAVAPGGSEYRRRKSELRQEYKEKRRSLRSAHRGYVRGGRRVVRGAKRVGEAAGMGGGLFGGGGVPGKRTYSARRREWSAA